MMKKYPDWHYIDCRSTSCSRWYYTQRFEVLEAERNWWRWLCSAAWPKLTSTTVANEYYRYPSAGWRGRAAPTEFKPTSMTYRSAEKGYIDKVLLTTTDADQTLIKVLMWQTRRPEIGDKFSSRHGQKGVCGIIIQQEDMPFSDHGSVPILS